MPGAPAVKMLTKLSFSRRLGRLEHLQRNHHFRFPPRKQKPSTCLQKKICGGLTSVSEVYPFCRRTLLRIRPSHSLRETCREGELQRSQRDFGQHITNGRDVHSKQIYWLVRGLSRIVEGIYLTVIGHLLYLQSRIGWARVQKQRNPQVSQLISRLECPVSSILLKYLMNGR